MRNRRGFTLVEILVSLVIMLIVSGAIYKMLNSSQRLTRAQAERVSLQSNVRSGALVVPTELRELSTFVGGDADQNDVLAATADERHTYRAMRGIGFVCQTLGRPRSGLPAPPSRTVARLFRVPGPRGDPGSHLRLH